MKDLRQNPSDAEIRDIINEGDTDNDGAIDFPGKHLLPARLLISLSKEIKLIDLILE